MARQNDRKLHLSLESLENRNLQSAIVTNANPSDLPAGTNSAVIASNSPQLQANLSSHNYHGTFGFFGQ